MHTKSHIIIINPLQLIERINHIPSILRLLLKLCDYHLFENPDSIKQKKNDKKQLSILLLDMHINQHYYKESPCHIIK